MALCSSEDRDITYMLDAIGKQYETLSQQRERMVKVFFNSYNKLCYSYFI